jgi:membrane protease YdiL (CAAX protease family)
MSSPFGSPLSSPFNNDRQPFWGYEDLALFIGAMLPALGVAALVVRPFRLPDGAVRTVSFQVVFYALLLAALYFLIAVKHGRPLWRSLGWTFGFSPMWIAGGAPLAIGLGALAWFLHAPEEPLIQNLITDRLSLILMLIFGALIGPIFEEIVFRGFLLPLLAGSLGDFAGVLLAAGLFAVLHGPEYHWAWQVLLTVGLAGVAFGVARIKTGSTAAAAMLHVGYNATLFAGFLVARSVQP